MKIQSIFNYVAIAACSLSLASCNDFLDLAPISDLTSGNAYQTASDAEAALTGCYDSFQSEYFTWDNINFSDVRSDNCYAGGDNGDITQIDLCDFRPANPRFFSTWQSLYTGIAKCNVVLDKVPGINDPQLDINNRKSQILGEASFIRAKFYFELVKLFGGVPLMLTPTTSADPSQTNVPRSTEIEVYNQIVLDLEFAATNLPDTYNDDATVNKARATKGAANALLAKIWAQRSDRDYGKVLNYCDLVIGSPARYALLTDFNQLFDGNHYNNAESILEVQYIGGAEANWGPQLLLPPSVSGDGWRKFVTPSHDLVNAYDAQNDNIRKNASILVEAVDWVDEYWYNTPGSSVPFSFRWKSANGWASTNRQYFLRLADIILLRAEALNQLGRSSEALTDLNLVRARVQLPASTVTGKENIAVAIENERRLELFQEAERWYDLVRSGRLVTVMNSLNEIDLRTGKKVNYKMTANKALFPIPQNEISRNPSLEQNPL